MIQKTLYVLAVNDLEASAAWYRDALGFAIHEIGDPGWRMYVRDNCRIMAGDCPDAIPAAELGDHSYFAYWIVDDAQRLFEEYQSKGVEILKAIRDEPWGMREFALRTIDGHRIMVGEELNPAS